MSAANREDIEYFRHWYRLMFGSALALAAVGAPLLMQGAVALADGFSSAPPGPSALTSIVLFGLSATPMALAALAWRRSQYFRRFIDTNA
jgi:hypothetical protein